MSLISNKENSRFRKSVIIVTVLLLLTLCIWKSNTKPEILCAFLIPGLLSAIILFISKRTKLSTATILFSCFFSSLICSGLYIAFNYLFERYLLKLNTAYVPGIDYTVGSVSYNIPGMVLCLLAYPIVLVSVTGLTILIIRGFASLRIKEIWSEIKLNFKDKAAIRTPCILLLNLVFAAIIGTLVIWGAYSLPMDKIDENVISSADTLYKEGSYPSLYCWCFSRSDNFSDAIILLEASDKNNASTLENALLSYIGNINGCDSVQILKKHFIDGIEYDSEVSYSRYWQGYLATVKPLLEITDYNGIRVVNISIQITLIVLICIMLVRKGRKDIIIPFLISYLMLVPPVMGRCMFFSSCFIVTLLSVTVMLFLKSKKHLPILFLYTGIAAVYVDLMSFPIMTFGIPAVVCLSLHADDCAEEKLLQTVKNGLSWCLGFAGMWILKWIIADIFTEGDVIRSALNMVAVRTSSSDAGAESFSVYSVFGRNIIAFVFTPLTLLVIAFLIYLIIRNRKATPETFKSPGTMLPSVLISLFPFFWYAFAANHSIIHYWFTCKSLVITIFAIMCALSDTLLQHDRQSLSEVSIHAKHE